MGVEKSVSRSLLVTPETMGHWGHRQFPTVGLYPKAGPTLAPQVPKDLLFRSWSPKKALKTLLFGYLGG